jgi:polyhydroxybutyrate depolymerase
MHTSKLIGLTSLLALVAGVLLVFVAPDSERVSAAGCGPARPHAPGSSNETFASSEGPRDYILHVPPSYTGATKVPLIFNFHGLGSTAAQQESYSDFSTRADEPDGGFIVVYPQGSETILLAARHWNIVKLGPPEFDDVAFIDELLTDLETSLCIDANKVFATGMSNGGQMSVRLACSLSSRIAAVAPVTGSYYPPFSTPPISTDDCPDTRPVPFINFHGTNDTCVPWTGGPGCGSFSFRLPIDNDTPDDDVMQSWGAHNGCTGGRQETTVTDDVSLVEYTNCTDGVPTQLYVVQDGGHTWPGSPFGMPPATTQDISATDLIWDFFQQNSFPTQPTPTPAPKDPDADTDGDTILNSVDGDDDNDGCLDTAEDQLVKGSQSSGGLRNAHSVWDFFDTPNPNAVPQRDKVVNVDDLFRITARFATTGTPGDPLSTPPKTGYHAAYDRAFEGPDAWDLGPADGSIGLDEVFWIAAQFAHSCA